MPQYLTKKGLEKIKQELDGLREKRPDIARKLKEAASFGDLSENSEYVEAKESQAFIEGRIKELEDILREAIIINNPNRLNQIGIGSVVKVLCSYGKETFSVVGAAEVSPRDNKISIESPLGMAFLGKQKGEIVIVDTPKGEKVKYKIVGIR